MKNNYGTVYVCVSVSVCVWYTHCELVHVNPHFTRTRNIPEHATVRVHAKLAVSNTSYQYQELDVIFRKDTEIPYVYGKQNERNK